MTHKVYYMWSYDIHLFSMGEKGLSMVVNHAYILLRNSEDRIV